MWEARTGRFEITSDTVNETADYPETCCCRTTWQRSRTSSGPSPPGASRNNRPDGLRVVEVTLAMIESARRRRSVKIERAEP